MKKPADIDLVVGKFVTVNRKNSLVEFGFITPRISRGRQVVLSIAWGGRGRAADYTVYLDRICAPWSGITECPLNGHMRKIVTKQLGNIDKHEIKPDGSWVDVGCETKVDPQKFLQTLQAIKRRYKLKFTIPEILTKGDSK